MDGSRQRQDAVRVLPHNLRQTRAGRRWDSPGERRPEGDLAKATWQDGLRPTWFGKAWGVPR